jgi:preprotein translocase subunit SecE
LMAGIRAYVEEAVDELGNKVSWPTWSELQSSGIVVLVATFIIAGVIYMMDLAFGQIMDLIYLKIFG